MNARRNQEVSRSFGRGTRQDGRLEFIEAKLIHPSPYTKNKFRAEKYILMEFGSSQIDIPIAQSGVLGCGIFRKNREWQRFAP